MTVKAIYENGVLKPKSPLPLKEHEEVDLEISRSSAPSPDDDDPTGWKAADELIGFIKDGPTDGAENHDSYIYRK
jgi:predicted DNA-binding antitoxin AbrB/MazE fold protein